MQKISLSLLKELTSVQAQPCISIYMPTHPIRPESPRDPITFKNLYKDIAQYIEDNALTAHKKMLPEILKLVDNKSFWDNADRGVAILASEEAITILHLPERVEEMTYVSDSYYLKPLFKLYQENQPYYLLALNLDDVALYRGDRYQIETVDIADKLPGSMKEALGDQLTDNHLHGSVVIGAGLHGYMEKSQEEDIDMDRFFREVDRALSEHFPTTKDTPMILAMLPEHHTAFLRISKYPHLAPTHIQTNPLAWDKETLLQKAQELGATTREKYHKNIVDRYEDVIHLGLGCADLECAVRDAREGKIETLCLEEHRDIPGNFNAEEHSTDERIQEDILTKLAEMVFKFGGQIVILPADQMPTDTGFFSINRY